MANINKIKLSGTTYNIQDLNATKTVELTQAEYDALSPKDPNTFYIITDATAGDLSNYYTKTETNDLLDTKLDVTAYSPTDLSNYYTKSETSGATEISTALASKADTLISGTNIKTINNQSILGEGNITIEGGSGGGKAIEAGRGISITTGETADTVSFNLPISGGTNALGPVKNAIIMGENTTASSKCSIAIGTSTFANGYRAFAGGVGSRARAEGAFAFGCYVDSLQNYETAFGEYNVSNKASSTFGDSGNTLFSVGNGTSNSARHNAFEIRQNGDIYLTKDGQDVKLQDQLGGGGSSYTAGDGIDITNDAISVTGKVDTSAITTTITSSSTDAQVPSAKAVNDKLGGLSLVKLTQSEYSAMEQAGTLDNSTLYIVIGS